MPAIPAITNAALRNSLAKYNGEVSADVLQQIFGKLKTGLESILNPQQVDRGGEFTVTVGDNYADVRARITKLLAQVENPQALTDTLNLDFKLSVAEDVARGAGRFVAENKPAFVNELPAWELLRVYDRETPRGYRKAKGGAVVSVPDDDWPSRFRDACNAAGDADALNVLESTGRMVALKSSGVWDELGSNRDDTLGNPYPPFAFNSGYDVDQVNYEDCVALGLLDAGDKPEPAEFDPAKLFAPLGVAA